MRVWFLWQVDRYELAWAAGFFDGEGWAAAVRDRARATLRPMARINQADANGVPEVLTRFQSALGGLGRIGGPDVVAGRRDLYRWVVSSRSDVELLQHFLLPWLGEVKLRALGSALERPPARSRHADPSDEWRAWAAGLYDGEGSTGLREHRTHAGHKIAELALTQSGQGTPEVLARLSCIVARGHIFGPYIQKGANLDVYRWKVEAQREIEPALMTLWPWLGAVKRTQAAPALATLRRQVQLPRGNPSWGNRKISCVNGHEYATARIRPFTSRKGGTEPRDSSACLACLREYARRRREEKERSAADDGGRSISDGFARYLLK